MSDPSRAYRAALFYFIGAPQLGSDKQWVYIADGLLLVQNGRVISCGDFVDSEETLDPECEVIDYRPALILPGFIDSHVHYVQSGMIASAAPDLLGWLERYTFPAEQAFADKEYAQQEARFFVDQLLANGTTTAMVFASRHAHSVDAIFEAGSARRMRLISGRVMMDRNAPSALCDDAMDSYEESQALIERWHGHERLAYAVTPRFAATSSEQQLRLAGRLFADTPDVYLQSHVAENPSEVAWVAEMFPVSRSYLDVYDSFGLLGPRALYAHGIYLDDQDRQRLAKSGTALSFCPSSNLFLGSGLFDVESTVVQGVPLALGSDVGAGTSLNMLDNMQDAYKVMQLTRARLSPLYPLYLATLGGARALGLEAIVGSLEAGNDADFIVLDPTRDEMLERRLQSAESVEEMMFALMMLGGRGIVRATYCQGENVMTTAGVSAA